MPSLIVAVACSWLLVPKGIDNVAGATFTETAVAGITVRLAVPVTVPEVALIVAVPSTLATAAPATLTLAFAGADEIQVAVCVRFCVLPSVNVPVAVNCSVSPIGKETWFGVTATLTRTGGPTVIDELLLSA